MTASVGRPRLTGNDRLRVLVRLSPEAYAAWQRMSKTTKGKWSAEWSQAIEKAMTSEVGK